MTEKDRTEMNDNEKIIADSYDDEMVFDAHEELEEDFEPVYTFKCKPCYNFQSVEFEFEGTKYDLDELMEVYSLVLQMLKAIAPDQANGKPVVKEPATDKQLTLLKKLGVKFDKFISKEEARKLIKEAMDS